jgi:hypothetical protein
MGNFFELSFSAVEMNFKFFFTVSSTSELVALFVSDNHNKGDVELIQEDAEKFPEYYRDRVNNDVISVLATNLKEARKLAAIEFNLN